MVMFNPFAFIAGSQQEKYSKKICQHISHRYSKIALQQIKHFSLKILLTIQSIKMAFYQRLQKS